MAQEKPGCSNSVPNGDSQILEKMEQRTCVLCPEGHDWSVIYFAPSANIAAHENCLEPVSIPSTHMVAHDHHGRSLPEDYDLYSSGLVECEPHDPDNPARNFAVKSVKKEIWRGKRLKCSLCHKGGATVGCDLSYCRKSYHYVCAKRDHATLQVDGHHGTYKIFCPEHPPQKEETTECADSPIMKKTGRKKRLSSGPPTEPKKMKYSSYKRLMKEEPHGHKDAAVKAPFLKKCQEAGLLTELFEQILEKIDSIHGRFMDETASESDYEGIETLLFDCGLFGDILRKFQEVIKSKTCEYEERLSQMKQKLEALADLQTLCPFQEYGDLDLSSSTSGSLLLPEDHQFRYQESPEVQAGSGDSL